MPHCDEGTRHGDELESREADWRLVKKNEVWHEDRQMHREEEARP